MTQTSGLGANIAGGLTIAGCTAAFFLSSAAPLLISVAIKIAAIAMIAIAIYHLVDMCANKDTSAESFFKKCKASICNIPDMICHPCTYIKICREKFNSAINKSKLENSDNLEDQIVSGIQIAKSEIIIKKEEGKSWFRKLFN